MGHHHDIILKSEREETISASQTARRPFIEFYTLLVVVCIEEIGVDRGS